MKTVTVTFDNGPFEPGTSAVLRALGERGIKSTFFLVGKQLTPATRHLAEQAKAEGHLIGSHTLHHDIPLGRDEAPPGHHLKQIGGMQALLGELGEVPPLFRPYAGKGLLGPHVLTQEAVRYLGDHGYTIALWNSVPRDWEQPADGWVQRAFDDIERLDWPCIVLHDRPSDTMKHLPRFLDLALERNLRFVQEIPPDCMPMIAGKQVADMSHLISTAS